MLGNVISEVLNKRGVIILSTNSIETYKSVTGKTLDPANYVFDNLENPIRKKVLARLNLVFYDQSTTRICQSR